MIYLLNYQKFSGSAYIVKKAIIIGASLRDRLCETIATQEEMIRAVDCGKFFGIVADNRNLNYDRYIFGSNKHLDVSYSYHLHNASRFDAKKEETTRLL